MANPALICQQLLSQLRLSNLNFLLSETPYSAQIILRKRFVKECLGPEAAFLLAPDQIDNKNEVINLREEIVNLKKELEALEIARNVEKDKEKILEEKIGNIEAEALKAYKKQEAEISTMKNLNRNLNTEIDKLKSEMSSKIKSCKQKDKEVHRLENKCDNLASNLKQTKSLHLGEPLGHLVSFHQVTHLLLPPLVHDHHPMLYLIRQWHLLTQHNQRVLRQEANYCQPHQLLLLVLARLILHHHVGGQHLQM